ncbi:MAG: sigma-54 dependent transcriptional regulator [SAR324 cluster bacterium]|nr:sigma-54 dependent transcriptional regulator [SAR324 cluster bacterium]MCZ6557231.1 sigma-54 dependent transcriptional regulator [SAR324 cluster bacterium]
MNILIVDENEVVRRQLFWALRGGNDLQEAASREEAEAILTSMVPDVVLMELLQEGDSDESAGTALVERVLRRAEPPLIIIITRSNRKDVAGALLQAGVFDYLEKPVNLTDLPGILNRAKRYRELRAAPGERAGQTREVTAKGKEASEPEPQLDVIGVDPRIKQILEQIRRIAATPVSVLITGETGVGKEIFAQSIHRLSDRRDQRFVPLNCAVLTDNLVEDELFGHEKGAFTGAIARRLGKFEQANNGSLFLDEIGDLSPHLQAKFLRVLQERQFERLGGNQPINTDFRLICATHQDLHKMTKARTFREDLMFRLTVVSFHIPPLRERRGDIKLMAQHFLREYAEAFGRQDEMSFSPEVMRFMYDYPWPGNVRELKHFVERAVALTEGRVMGMATLPETITPTLQGESLSTDGGSFNTMIKKYKRQLVMEALEMAGNNKIQTAHILGISKSYLFKLIKQLAVPN